MTFWTLCALIGSAAAAWLGVVGLLWRFGRAMVRGIGAHITVTNANTAALATLTASVNEHVQSTNRAVSTLDARVTRLENPHHAA